MNNIKKIVNEDFSASQNLDTKHATNLRTQTDFYLKRNS